MAALGIADPVRYPAGFVLARVAGEEGEIISIGVARNSRGRGFGTKICVRWNSGPGK